MIFARILVLAVLSIGAPFVNTTSASALESCPAFSAHRGDHQSGYAEESLPAMLSAIDKGATWIDMDVRPSLNGNLFLHHDSDGLVETHTTDWLKAHNVPYLSQVLRGTKFAGVQAFVEIKNPRAGTYIKAVKLFKEYGIGRIIVTSYSRTTLNSYRAVYPKGRVSLNVAGAHAPSYFKHYQSATINAKVATPEYVASLKSAGLPVYVFTPNTQAEWTALPNVDGVITDNIDGYNNYCGGA